MKSAIVRKVVNLLVNNEGLTVEDIAGAIHLDWLTASRLLEYLREEQLADYDQASELWFTWNYLNVRPD